MFENSDRIRLHFILQMISDIEMIVERHGGGKATLDDVEGRHAVLMCFMQIGESMNKITTESIRQNLPTDLAYTMRNIIAHDYLGINQKIIEQTIEQDLPVLKATISKHLIQNS